MKDYVLDANAVLRYFRVGEAEGGDRVLALFEQAEKEQVRLLMSVINLGEVFYVLLRHVEEQQALHYVHALERVVTIVDADVPTTMRAARLKHQYKLGYADSFAAAVALSFKATLVSADPSFEKLGKSLKWVKLPRFNPKAR